MIRRPLLGGNNIVLRRAAAQSREKQPFCPQSPKRRLAWRRNGTQHTFMMQFVFLFCAR